MFQQKLFSLGGGGVQGGGYDRGFHEIERPLARNCNPMFDSFMEPNFQKKWCPLIFIELSTQYVVKGYFMDVWNKIVCCPELLLGTNLPFGFPIVSAGTFSIRSQQQGNNIGFWDKWQMTRIVSKNE